MKRMTVVGVITGALVYLPCVSVGFQEEDILGFRREDQLNALDKYGGGGGSLDVLIVGGGAVGTSCLLDGVSRGLTCALVEGADFASGTSSRSTKMFHGGVRYLEKAVWNLDMGQFRLVQEALEERKSLLKLASYLAHPFAIMTPCYKYWELPYYWLGLQFYNIVAAVGGYSLYPSRYMSVEESLRMFPTIAPKNGDGDALKGSVVYHDGQFNDSRFAVLMACTAISEGAIAVNHCKVTDLIYDNNSRVIGVKVVDMLSNETRNVYAKVVVNCCGPQVDQLRTAKPIISPSSGVHITLPSYYSPDGTGLVVPKTKDGRVVFMLPWLGYTIAGTTDTPCDPELYGVVSKKEVDFILDSIDPYLKINARNSDVLSCWSGIRPLAADPGKESEAISREHTIVVEDNGMISIAGGKWTTCRKMAQDAIDRIMSQLKYPERPCKTKDLHLLGANNWTPALYSEISQTYTVPHRRGAIDVNVAKHLSQSYGTRAFVITKLSEEMGLGHRLVYGHNVLEAEVVYCCRYELCETPIDFLCNRSRLAFLDVKAAYQALPRVVQLMAREKGWSEHDQVQRTREAKMCLESFQY